MKRKSTNKDINLPSASSSGVTTRTNLRLDNDRINGAENRQRQSVRQKANTYQEEDFDDETLFHVEAILDVKVEKGLRSFLVKWTGYTEEHNSWVPDENMDGCLEMKNKFLARRSATLQKQAVNENKRLKSQKIMDKRVRLDHSQISQQVANGQPKLVLQNFVPPRQGAMISPNINEAQSQQEIRKSQCARQLSNLNRQTVPVPIQSQMTPGHNLVEVDLVVPLMESNDLNLTNKRIIQHYPPRVDYLFRIYANDEEQLLNLNIQDSNEEFYNVVITENIQNKCPNYIYGAVQDVNGNQYCLVEFEGQPNLIDIVPPSKLLQRFPRIAQYFNKQFS